jgi:hypothetical protein
LISLDSPATVVTPVAQQSPASGQETLITSPGGNPVAPVVVQLSPPSVDVSTSLEVASGPMELAMQVPEDPHDSELRRPKPERPDGITAAVQLDPPSVV